MTGTGDFDDSPYGTALRETARILNSPSWAVMMKAQADAQQAIARIWTPGLVSAIEEQGRVIASVPLDDLNKLAAHAARLSAVVTPRPKTPRAALLDLYDDLAKDEFQHPLLSPTNLATARDFITSVPDAVPPAFPAAEVSPELDEQIGSLVAEVSEQVPGASLERRAENVGSAVATLVMTLMLVGWALVPELSDKGMLLYHCLDLVKKIRELAVEKYKAARTHGQDG